MTVALTHIWLFVDYMPRALSFYRDTLGLTVLNNLGQYVEFNVSQEFQLALFERTAMAEGEPQVVISPASGQRANLAFEVGELDPFCAQLRERGVTFVRAEANHPEWGLRTAFLQDPDGNLVCLYSGIPMEETAAE